MCLFSENELNNHEKETSIMKQKLLLIKELKESLGNKSNSYSISKQEKNP